MASRRGGTARPAGPLLPFDGAAPQPAAPTQAAREAPAAAPVAPGVPAGSVRRVFLGWQRPVLHAAAEWIVAELGAELGDLLIAVPGARAARRLRELLAERSSPAWTPPRVLTQGELVDELVRLERPVAGRLARTLVWERALASLDPERRARLQRARAPEAPDARLRLAETVRALHGELAPEGADFASLTRGPWRDGLESEALRWEALAAAQARYRETLERLGLADPHEGRARAIAEGALDRSRRVVLVGVADMNHLLARALTALASHAAAAAPHVTALVGAPAELAGDFDGLGRLRPESWREREVPLSIADWRVAEKPVDQAETVRAVLDEWHGELAPHELTLGVADESVVPYLERQLEDCGARARRAAGTPVERTRPLRLLRALGRYLARRDFAELAALARDPDLATAVAGDADAPARFDRYHLEHLPRRAGEWLGEREADLAVRSFHERLERALGPLADGKRRALAEWAAPLRAFLARVYPQRLSEAREPERVLMEALRHVGDALGELDEVPAELGLAEVSASEALQLVTSALRGRRVPPPPAESLGAAVELVGWLDLALDDAPALILTGFDEGRIPQAVGVHAFLPDARRAELGLPSEVDRVARDVYAANVVLRSRARCVFVSARRSAEGDPLVPSRLAFHRPAHEVPARVARFTRGDHAHAPLADDDAALGPRHACPSIDGWTVPTKLRVSAFKTYLSSPYLFYLECVLGLETLDDRVAELDPRRFGTLAHGVLEDLARGPHDSADARAVGDYLVARLRARAADAFGPSPLPAAGLQLAQLELRLRAFAARQAERAAEGWRIHAAEWKPHEPVLLDVDGAPMQITGKLDRIDVHPDGRWAILDYKTGDRRRNPRDAHRRKDKARSWIDLQLPLYRLLGEQLGLAGEPELGYAWIGKEEHDTGFFLGDFSVDELEEGLEVARRVVREVRAGNVLEPGEPRLYDEIWKAIFGRSALGGEDEEGAA